jgi:hypothetical protein
MYTNTAKNSMLQAIGITHVSLHDGYPGTTGLNEISGGTPAYARKAITFAAAASGSKAASTQPLLDVPAGKTIRYVGFWDAVSAGNFLGCVPNGGSEKEFIVDLANNKLLSDAHGLANGDRVVIFGTTPPGATAVGTIYFVVSAATNDLKLSLTSGGAAITLTTVSSYDCTLSKLVEEVFGAQGQHQVNALTLNLNA